MHSEGKSQAIRKGLKIGGKYYFLLQISQISDILEEFYAIFFIFALCDWNHAFVFYKILKWY